MIGTDLQPKVCTHSMLSFVRRTRGPEGRATALGYAEFAVKSRVGEWCEPMRSFMRCVWGTWGTAETVIYLARCAGYFDLDMTIREDMTILTDCQERVPQSPRGARHVASFATMLTIACLFDIHHHPTQFIADISHGRRHSI